MHRIFKSAVSIGLFSFACFSLGFGCHVIADIEDRGFADGGGGASSSSSGDVVSTSSSSSSSSSSGMMTMSCETNPPGSMGCGGVMCTDPASATTGCHCGDCGIDCGNGMGGQCLSGGLCPPKLMAYTPEFGRIHRVATHGGTVVYADYDEQQATTKLIGLTLDGVPIAKSMNPVIEGYVQALALDCDTIYFATVPRANSAGVPMGIHALWSMRITGTTVTKFPDLKDFYGTQYESIVVDDRYVYWTDELGVGIMPKPGGPQMGGPERVPMHDLTTTAVGLAVRGTDVYWSTTPKDPNTADSKILHTMITSFPPPPPTIKSTYPKGNPKQIAVDDIDIYWVDASNMAPHTVMRVSRGAPQNTPPEAFFTFPTTLSLLEPISVDRLDPFVHVIAHDTAQTSSSTCRLKKDIKPTVCEPHTGATTGIKIGETWFARGGSRIYVATPKENATNAGQLHWITVGKLKP